MLPINIRGGGCGTRALIARASIYLFNYSSINSYYVYIEPCRNDDRALCLHVCEYMPRKSLREAQLRGLGLGIKMPHTRITRVHALATAVIIPLFRCL